MKIIEQNRYFMFHTKQGIHKQQKKKIRETVFLFRNPIFENVQKNNLQH